jgi:hypothetical protein
MDIRLFWRPLRFGVSLTVRRNPVGTLLATAAGKQESVVGFLFTSVGVVVDCREAGVQPPISDLSQTLLPLCLPF